MPYGERIYELQTGMAALFNLGVNRAFTSESFHEELARLQSLPDFQKFRAALDRFGSTTEHESLEELLKKYKGPVH